MASAQSLFVGRHLLSLPAPAPVAQGPGGRQDGGEQPDDRSRDRKAWPDALRSARRLQLVRDGVAGRHARPRRRRERGRVLPSSRRRCLAGGQRRHRLGTTRGGDHRSARPRPGRDLPGAGARARCTGVRSDGGAGPPPSKNDGSGDSHRSRSGGQTWLARTSKPSLLTPGNGAPIGGLKVIAKSGWFAARPSGTKSIYKMYAESFVGADHLRRVLEDPQAIVDYALETPPK